MPVEIGAATGGGKGPDALVVGAGPAGLMAAEVLSAGERRVLVVDRMPSVGRKFLMAGKSGLNLTNDANAAALAAATDAPRLAPILAGFDAAAVRSWAEGLGQPMFVGSSGRVFPRAMKASPLLRAWLARLSAAGVEIRPRHRWTGFAGPAAILETPSGSDRITAPVTVLALGGASWRRLGADGAWAGPLAAAGAAVTRFSPVNVGLSVAWSDRMAPLFGRPVKAVRWRAGDLSSRGEAILSARGLEGGGIYTVSAAVAAGAELTVDLAPDLDLATLAGRLGAPRGKATRSARLRKAAGLDPVRLALFNEFSRGTADADLAATLKALPIPGVGTLPLDDAISVAGGVAWPGVTPDLMLTARPGTFVAGEMLDWAAPTGGYLLTACLATGRHAGLGALAYLSRS